MRGGCFNNLRKREKIEAALAVSEDIVALDNDGQPRAWFAGELRLSAPICLRLVFEGKLIPLDDIRTGCGGVIGTAYRYDPAPEPETVYSVP